MSEITEINMAISTKIYSVTCQSLSKRWKGFTTLDEINIKRIKSIFSVLL